MIVIICCLLIFVTFLAMCALLSYYFFKKRLLWDSIFSSESISNSLTEILLCPEHFVIWLPWLEFEDTKCVLDRKQKDDTKIKIKKVLEYVNNIMKNISNININDIDNKNDIDNENDIDNKNKICNLEKIKWILEGTLKDFFKMYEENVDFYNNLSNSYEILHKKINDKVNDKLNDNNKLCLSLEDLVILENNIEMCDNISNILSVFSDSEYKLWYQIESGNMQALILDLIENVRIYKIKNLEKT